MQPYPHPHPHPQPPQPRQGMSGCAIAGIALGVLAFVAVLAVCAGFFVLGRAREQARSNVLSQPATTVDAATLVADYDANEVRANSSYQGRHLELVARIEKIETDLGGKPGIVLAAGHLIRRVHCHFGAGELERFATLQKGQYARVRGVCRGLFVHVQLDNCSLLEVLDEEP